MLCSAKKKKKKTLLSAIKTRKLHLCVCVLLFLPNVTGLELGPRLFAVRCVCGEIVYSPSVTTVAAGTAEWKMSVVRSGNVMRDFTHSASHKKSQVRSIQTTRRS